MGLSTWKDRYRLAGDEWPLERFVGIAGEVLDLLGIDERSVPNERLVRYYAAEGAMSKPGREGREVRYDYRHLVEFLVTRMLLKDGWPLSKVADFVSSSDHVSLEQMLPEEAPTLAQREVRAIKSAMRELPEPPSVRYQVAQSTPAPSSVAEAPEAYREELFGSPASASQKMLDLQGTMARGRSSVSQLLHSIGFGKHRPAWKETASIDLTPWCTVTFDAEQLRRLPHSAYEPLGEALSQSLREHRMATRRDRK
jgi:DNA-binding transcriptional MerR regulator